MAGKHPHPHQAKAGAGKGVARFADPKKANAEDKFQDELQVRWQAMLQRVRIHEMLKCLKSDRRKLRVLREHTDLDEIMEARFRELGAQVRKQELDELVSEELFAVQRKEKKKGAGPEENAPTKSSTMLRRASRSLSSNDSKDSNDSEKSKGSNGSVEDAEWRIIDDDNGQADLNALYIQTQKEEEEAMAEIYPNLKRVLADPKYVVKSAIKMFRTRSYIDEEEFEEILELCEDKIEQQALRDAFKDKQDREKFLGLADEKKQMLYTLINSNFFVRFMLAAVITSIIGIFLLTFENIFIRYGFLITFMDSCIIGIFLVEAMFKLIIYKRAYFTTLWNILDIMILAVYFMEVIIELVTKTLAITSDINSSIGFKFLKSMRALRLFRIIKFLPNLQVVVATVFHSMLSMGSIAVLMSLFIFVFAILGRGLFYEDAPEHFGNLGKTFVTLFQLLTLDDWFDVLQVINIDKHPDKTSQYWVMFVYLFCYIVIEYFVFLNLFVAVLVDNFQLTWAAAELRKQKEALIILEGQEKLNELAQDLGGGKPDENEDFINDPEYGNKNSLEMNVEDYFSTKKGSREAILLEHIYKDLASIDFERYLWKRRMAIMNSVFDRMTPAGSFHRFKLQDGDRLSFHNNEVLEKRQKNFQ